MQNSDEEQAWHRLTLRIKPETWDRLRLAAALETIDREESVSRSQLIREAARNYARRILQSSTPQEEELAQANLQH